MLAAHFERWTKEGSYMIEKFRTIFEIPEENELVEIEAKSRGLMGALESWKHEENDAEGNLVAIYESWHNVTPNLKSNSGFRKYFPTGELLSEANELKL